MLLDWKGQSIQVRELGEGPAVVLVHGYPLDGAMWSGVARALSRSHRVFKPDLPGRGDQRSGGARAGVGLAGFSMGGYVALALAKRDPAALRALALVDSRAGSDDDAGRKARDAAIDSVRAGGAAAIMDTMIEKLLAPASLGNASLVERLRRMILRQKTETLESDLTAMRDRPDSTEFLPRLKIPTIVLAGARVRSRSAALMCAALIDCATRCSRFR